MEWWTSYSKSIYVQEFMLSGYDMIYWIFLDLIPVMNTFIHVQYVQNESICLTKKMRHHNEDVSTNKPDSYHFIFSLPLFPCFIKKKYIYYNQWLHMSVIVISTSLLIIFNFITVKGVTIAII